MAERGGAVTRRARDAWSRQPRIKLLGSTSRPRLPIFSFRIRDGQSGYVHHQLITRLLSDRYGIQARGGCACAGPYVHRLLGIDEIASDQMRQAILSGNEIEKPGFVRLNLSPLMSDRKVQVVLDSVTELSRDAPDLERHYRCDPTSAIFAPVAGMALA